MLGKQRRLDEAEALAQAIEEPDWRALCLTYVRWDLCWPGRMQRLGLVD